MKRIFSTSFNNTLANIWLLIFRVSVAAFMLTHGFPKFTRLTSGDEIKFADPFDWGMYPSFVLVVFAEFICSILIILGLGTRLASVFLIIAMATAVIFAHGNDPFGKKELALLYLIIFFTLLIFGAGKYSLDHLIAGKSKSKRRY